MSEGKKPDPRRRKTSVPRSTNFTVPNGTKEVGYKAGELYGCYGHRVHAHQPCLHELTNGELQCPLCTAKVPLVWRGYVPMWDRDFTLRHALIGEDFYESVDMIPHRAQCVLSRDRARMSPLVIRAADAVMMRGLPEKRPWAEPVDMFAVCRVLWKSDEVDAWWACQVNKGVGVVGVGDQLDPDKFSPMMKAAAARVNRLDTVPSANELFVQAVKRAGEPPKPSTNGNHKKKGGDNA